jgi:excisionase family DNA binding protein
VDRPYRIPEAAKLMHVSRSTLYREWNDGRIRITKIRGGSFVMESEIVRYLRWAERKPRKAA